MNLPKTTLLSLLARAIDANVITRTDIEALLPKAKRKRKPGPCKVSPELRARCAELSKELGLTADGLRLRAHKLPAPSTQHVLYVYRGTSFAAHGISAQFTDTHDVAQAADRLVTLYLQQLDAQA